MTTSISHDSRAGSRFADLCQAPLPRGLREKAAHMSWDGFLATYGHRTGPVQLDDWHSDRPSRCSGPQARDYRARLTVAGRTHLMRASASGPVAALTAMLYENRIALEMLNFHQVQMGRDIVTFIRGTDGTTDEWAMAWAEDATQSALRAVIACVNRLAGLSTHAP